MKYVGWQIGYLTVAVWSLLIFSEYNGVSLHLVKQQVELFYELTLTKIFLDAVNIFFLVHFVFIIPYYYYKRYRQNLKSRKSEKLKPYKHSQERKKRVYSYFVTYDFRLRKISHNSNYYINYK